MDCRAKFSSSVVFFMKSGHFPCKIQFFWYFSNFQRLVSVRSASMTNKKPSGGVVCYYCHNPDHVHRKCRRLQCKNRRFESSKYQKSLKSASISITRLIESSKTNTYFISSSSTWVIDSGGTDYMTGNSSLYITF